MSDDEIRRNRRSFFQRGFQSVRDAVLETAHEVTKAAGELSDLATEALEEEPKPYHRARVRGPAAVGNRPIRPPGALEESLFLDRCSRCHLCIEACPEGAIFKAGPQHGPAVELSPIMEVTQRACMLCDGVPCAAACPSGALELVGRPEDIRIGTAAVLSNLCLNTRGEACDACLHVCPIGAQAIRIEEGSVPIIDPEHCTGCGQCVAHCRAYPRAIVVRPPSESVITGV
jgi:ferredoxin-type protein NapG